MSMPVWFETAFDELMQMGEQLPHALLLHGQRGIGKRELAVALAQSLLCEARLSNQQACRQCASCTWFRQGNHPDFRLVQPAWVNVNEPMLQPIGLVDGDDGTEGEGADSDATGKKTKTLSREIRIEQVRGLMDWISMGNHRGGVKVMVFYPAEAMNPHAANALLKTLEEPPPATHFILVTHRLDSLLPTIRSRCRLLGLPTPNQQQAMQWLQQQGLPEPAKALSYHGGAPLAAWFASQEPHRSEADKFSQLQAALASPEQMSALALAELLQKSPLNLVIAALQRWIYDIISLSSSTMIRYHPEQQAVLAKLVSRLGAKGTAQRELLAYAAQLNDAQRLAQHPLSAKLVLESLCLTYQRLFTS
ncbi:DNA polymerase III subunit delta' [Ampullimonas aquatilis]|uniref:DNA polymerase III subunit delta' n=1 Tax=Ampullimonas aquatilis TaxID=1341549 RepID=UPI003C785EC4